MCQRHFYYIIIISKGNSFLGANAVVVWANKLWTRIKIFKKNKKTHQHFNNSPERLKWLQLLQHGIYRSLKTVREITTCFGFWIRGKNYSADFSEEKKKEKKKRKTEEKEERREEGERVEGYTPVIDCTIHVIACTNRVIACTNRAIACTNK